MKKLHKEKVIENAEDAYDIVICELRTKERSISFEKVVRNLRKKRKL